MQQRGTQYLGSLHDISYLDTTQKFQHDFVETRVGCYIDFVFLAQTDMAINFGNHSQH